MHHLLRLCLLCLCFISLDLYAGQISLASGRTYAPSESAPSPLATVQATSPRASMQSFLQHSEQAIEIWRSGAEPQQYQYAFALAAQSLDLGQLASRTRDVVSVEKVMLLKSILERTGLPPLEQIPDEAQVSAEGIERWPIPHTPLVISRVDDGDRTGQFLLSARSVRELHRYWSLIEHLPDQAGQQMDLMYYFRVSPGPWIPNEWIWDGPAWLRVMVLSLPLWQWLLLGGALLLAGSLARITYLLGERWDLRISQSPWLRMGRPVALLLLIVLVLAVLALVEQGLWLYGLAYEVISVLVWALVFYFSSWFTMALLGRIALALTYRGEDEDQNNASLVIILSRIVGGIVVILITIYATEFMGYSISPLIASLSVGGLALALAARPMLENLINGLTLYADGGVRIGELCKFGDQIGIVEQIGLRSTKIRTLERSLITVPNSEFAQLQLDNLEKRDKRRMDTVLRLRHQTSMEQLRYLLVNIRKMLLAHPEVEKEQPLRVRFTGFGKYSLNAHLTAYIRCGDTDTFMAVQEDILFRVSDLVREAGTRFAFASQKEYLGRSEPLDVTEQQQAEEKVGQMRDENNLPFPEFSELFKLEIQDSLKYPPIGSVLHGKKRPDDETGK